jgi:hypothetical protein
MGKGLTPIKKKAINFVRNNVPLPATLAAGFEFNFSADKTKMTAEEWVAMEKQAYIDAAEAYVLRQAHKDPNGFEATTYFEIKT